MADRLLFIGWDEVSRGREDRAIECFNESVGYYGRLQQQGMIEGMDVCLLVPNGAGLQGYIALHGSADQLHRVREEEEFMRLFTEASICVDGMRILDGFTNEAIGRQMGMYQQAVAKVAQPA